MCYFCRKKQQNNKRLEVLRHIKLIPFNAYAY